MLFNYIVSPVKKLYVKKQSNKNPHKTKIIKIISRNVLFFLRAKYIKAVKKRGIASTSA